MASVPQKWTDEDGETAYEPAPGHRLPGWTVDALLEEGKVADGRAELEDLILAGVNSGIGRTIQNDADEDRLIEEMLARARVAGRTPQ